MKTTFKSKEGILADINILDHALINGYQIDKEKSTQVWMKLKSTVTGDNIMINTQKNLYYNMDYKFDKGDIIQFVANRLNGTMSVDTSKEAFYAALVNINKGLGNYLKEGNKNLIANKNSFIEKKEKIASMQSNEWNHVPMVDFNFLNNSRAINMDTLQSDYFKDRIFNTYVKMSSGHIITNAAFGKYINAELVGLEVRNNTIKNILGDHNGVFYTNTNNMKNIDAVFYAESAIDIASCIEILKANKNFDKSKNYCFLSFSGNLYKTKIATILADLDKLPISKNTQYISITDNDFDKEEHKNSGKQYDVLFTAALINKHITSLEYSTNETFFNYQFNDKTKIDVDALKDIVNIQNDAIDVLYDAKDRYGKYVILKESATGLVLNLPKSINLEECNFTSILKSLKAERLYISHKPKQDWEKERLRMSINLKEYKPKFSDNLTEELNTIISSKEYKPQFSNDWNEELKRRKGIQIEKKNELIINSQNKKNGIRI
jgi:hypothetical protein